MTTDATSHAVKALQRIANGRVENECGSDRKITRDEMVTIAREACDEQGLPYDQPSKKPE